MNSPLNKCDASFSKQYLVSWIESLSKDVFEGRTSTGSEPFSLFICLDANKFVLLSFFSLMKRIYPRVSNKPLPNNAKGPLPVDVRRSTTLLLKLPNVINNRRHVYYIYLLFEEGRKMYKEENFNWDSDLKIDRELPLSITVSKISILSTYSIQAILPIELGVQ